MEERSGHLRWAVAVSSTLRVLDTEERRNGADTDSGRWTALRLRGTDRALTLDSTLETRRNGEDSDKVGQYRRVKSTEEQRNRRYASERPNR